MRREKNIKQNTLTQAQALVLVSRTLYRPADFLHEMGNVTLYHKAAVAEWCARPYRIT
jgi:hypothetical protein